MSANAVAVASLGNPMTVASVGNIAFSLRDAATGTHLQDVGVPTAGDATSATFTFGGVAAGTYVIAAARQLADGSLAAPEVVSAPFTVVAPTATIPTSITVTLS